MRAAALTVMLFSLPALATAQATADDDALARAVVLFEESETLYNQGEFGQAAALLRRAYALHADPTLLFNLGRALEGAGDLDGAIDAYGRYLETADEAPDRGAVEARLTTLRAQRDALAGARASETEPAAPGATEDATEGGGGSVEIAPWLLVGGGGVVVGVGVALGVLSQDLASQAAAEPVQVEAVALHSDAQTFATVANVLYVAGGVIAGAGLVWGVVSLTSGDGDAQARLEVGPGSVGVRGTF